MSKQANQGEGDRASARRYAQRVREFVARGKVDEAAQSAGKFVDGHATEAERAERAAKRGPNARATVDDMIAKGRTWLGQLREKARQLGARAHKK